MTTTFSITHTIISLSIIKPIKTKSIFFERITIYDLPISEFAMKILKILFSPNQTRPFFTNVTPSLNAAETSYKTPLTHLTRQTASKETRHLIDSNIDHWEESALSSKRRKMVISSRQKRSIIVRGPDDCRLKHTHIYTHAHSHARQLLYHLGTVTWENKNERQDQQPSIFA